MNIVRYGGFGPPHGPGWWLLPALLLAGAVVLVAIAIVLVVVRFLRSGQLWRAGERTSEAERLLELRLARGEISVEEFRERLAVLRQPRERPTS